MSWPALLYVLQPFLLALPGVIFVGRLAMGYGGWMLILAMFFIFPLMLLFQLGFWTLSKRAARRSGRRRLGVSWVPFSVYLAAALFWPFAFGDSGDAIGSERPSVLERLTGMNWDGVGAAALLIMAVAGVLSLVLASLRS